jgi:tetratricopeptide (TPR) repeat protein
MKILLSLLFSMVLMAGVRAQDIPILFKQADNFEKQQKEAEALETYKQILLQDPVNIQALVKAAELNTSISNRQEDKNNRKMYVETGYSFAKRAWNSDSSNADAAYAMALVSGKMTDVETDNKKRMGYARDIKLYTDKALAANPDHAKANFLLGRWHYEMSSLSGLKKAAVKVLYGGIPETSFEEAIKYLGKCKKLEPYFANNYLYLAKSYKDNHQPAQAIEVLNKLVKLPTRTSDDVAIKAEGAKLLAEMQ